MLPAAGSSPRARGTVLDLLRGQDGARFIPASAGNGSRGFMSSSTRAVHPRERGERKNKLSDLNDHLGSSPRARGTVLQEGAAGGLHRFIPASAGNGRARLGSGRWGSVHPRERGERASRAAIRASRCGSSPRARGTVLHVGSRAVRLRFIPASAGNGVRQLFQGRLKPVHPRERGERQYGVKQVTHQHGSSPRARGTGFW